MWVLPRCSYFRSNLKQALSQNERVIADRGYGDEKCMTLSRLTEDERNLAADIRARHETVNARFKKFGVLRSLCRHIRSKHSICFHAVANITQLMMDTDPLVLQSRRTSRAAA